MRDAQKARTICYICDRVVWSSQEGQRRLKLVFKKLVELMKQRREGGKPWEKGTSM